LKNQIGRQTITGAKGKIILRRRMREKIDETGENN